MKKTGILALSMLFLVTLCFAQQTTKEEDNKIDENNFKQGFWKEKDGKKVAKGYYKDNKREGNWVTYHANGLVNKVEFYMDGKKDGIGIYIDKRGYFSREAHYKNDLKHGVEKKYGQGGRKLAVINYEMGKIHGMKKMFYPNNYNVQEESYWKKGKKDGVAKWFDNKGNLIAEYNYIDGKFQGENKTFYANKNLQSIATYKNNIQVGEYFEYYEGGEIKVQGQYIKGKKGGKWIEFDEKGNQVKVIKYKNGVAK